MQNPAMGPGITFNSKRGDKPGIVTRQGSRPEGGHPREARPSRGRGSVLSSHVCTGSTWWVTAQDAVVGGRASWIAGGSGRAVWAAGRGTGGGAGADGHLHPGGRELHRALRPPTLPHALWPVRTPFSHALIPLLAPQPGDSKLTS